MRETSLATVDVGAIPVVDADVNSIIAAVAVPASETRLIFALHVGGLALRRDPAFVDVMRQADLVYADGAAIVMLARLAGARQIGRAATTDIGLPIIEATAGRVGRDVRVALVGGKPSAAERAARAIERMPSASVVYTTDGYRRDHDAVVQELNACRPDLVFVGMGMPLEAMWASQWRQQLPPCTVITCGGWFGFLNGDEPRAPRWMIQAHLEWLHRLILDPRRLVGRYARGLVETAVAVPAQVYKRRSVRSDGADG